MRVVSADHDLDPPNRFAVVVDPDAEPVDWDESLAEFLLAIVDKRRSVGTPAADSSIHISGATKGYCDASGRI